jgi:hypothetical protein
MQLKSLRWLLPLVLAGCSSSHTDTHTDSPQKTDSSGPGDVVAVGGSGGDGGSGNSNPSNYSTSGSGHVCPTEDPQADGKCSSGDAADVACGSLRSGATLVHGADAVYLKFGAPRKVLRLTPQGPGAPLDTSGLMVAEPYVYWSSDKGYGRTKLDGSEPAELLTDACLPITPYPFSEGTGIYTPNWSNNPSGTLSRDLNDPERNRMWLHSGASGRVLGVDGQLIYVEAPNALLALDATERCACTCTSGNQDAAEPAPGAGGTGTAGNGPGPQLTCGTTPPPGSGGSPTTDAACIGHHTYERYTATGMTASAMDATHLYAADEGTLLRIANSGPTPQNPSAAVETPTVILPRPGVDAFSARIKALDLDNEYAYVARNVTFDGESREELLRVAKDGSEVVSLAEEAYETIVSVATDATNVYFVVAQDQGCRFVVRSIPKQPAQP